ncbi:hypothetical protein Trydic_g22876 [Trypoxylus dichotomus]
MDDIIKNTEVILLQAAQNLFLNGYYDQAITLLKQWQDCFEFLRIVNKNQTMKEETTLFVKKLENLSSIWRTLCDNVTISEDIKQTALKLGEEGRVLLAAVRKEGTLNAGGKFEWVDSVLIKCLQSGHWLVIDNVNLCSPAVLDRLNALLEPNGTLAISERGIGEDGKMIEIKPHKNFRLFLTMDPKNGEISRAMRNRGVELYLTNDYQNEINHDVKSLINIKGIQDNNIINLLLHMHNFIAELIIADKPNIESILHSAFLISQQLKRGIELEKAVTSTIVDIYYKSRSDYDFSTNDAMGAIKNEIQRLSPNSKALSLKVDLKTYHYAIKLYNKFNHLLWKNSYQLSNIKYDFMNLESEYIKNKLNTFFQSLGVSLNINVNNKDTIEIIKLCIEEIDLIETMAEDEKKVWRSLLTECHKQLLSLSNTSVITNMNAIASCHITASYLNALLNSKLPSIDPYTKVLLRRNYIAHEIENFETLNYSFQMQSSIYSNVEYPLCPLIKQHIQGLYQKTLELSKEVAVRPHSPEYCSLIMDINHAFRTVLSPAKIGTLYFKLEETFLQLEKGRADDFTTSCSDILQQARLCITSIENFINILNQYRYTYPDIIEPLYSNIMELLYGIKMKTKFANLAKFPVLDEDQCNMLDVINSYMDVPVQDMISSVSSLEKDSYFGEQTKLNLLKCAIQEIFNSCTTNARYSQIPVVDHYSEFNRLIKRFITTWNEQEKEIERKQNEKDSLYMTRTKCNDKSEEEQIEEEFENLFPTYFIEFSDMEAQELEDNPYAISPNEKESVITSDDINLIYNLHAAFLYSHSKSPWINLNEKHNYLDHIYPIMQKYKLLKLLLDDHRMLTALNYDVDRNILGSLHVLVNVAQSYGCIKVLDEVSSPSRALTKKSADFYRDPNINEVEPCYQILQQLRTQIQHLLLEWPEHPTLGSIITVIERICNFDIASPISRFLTGFDILLNKCHEWEENAHSGVSIQSHIVNVTAQIIVWRKLELNMWRDILNITFRRLNEPIGKWWCHIYQVVEQFQENIITTADLTSTLTKFITESNLAEFENRLELLFLFHCHCIHVKNSDKTNILINVLWNIYHYYKQSLAVVITKIKEFRSPIEKKLKDYIKIITWKDINYWSIKDTLRKTHKAIHKHVREYEKVLRQPVYPFLNEIDQQGTEYQGIGIWDRPQRTSPKSYHYTMDCLPYITRKGLSKKLSETTDIKMDKYFKKSLVLCKEIITLAPYPKYVKSLDLMVGEIIETSSHLQKLEVDTTLPKDKQKTLAKNILQQKHRSLADLFKLFTKIGVSFKKGILESKLNESAETKFTLEPINLEILFDHLNRQRNDEKILTMWDGCELYYLRSSLRLNMLEDALQQPSKDLGLPNVQRCKGFANDLMALINTQKQKLIRTSETFYYLRYYSNYFRDLCNETNFIHKDTFEDLRSTLSNLIIVIEQYKILFETCPEEPSDATILKTIPILKPVKDDVLCYKYDTIWNKSTGMLNEDLESIQMKLNNLLTLLGNIPLYNSLKWALKTVDDIKSKLLHPRTLTVNSERYLESIIKSSKALLEKFLISFQNIYKKYKCSTKIASTEDDPNLEEADGSLNDEHLKSLIMASLFDDLSCLNTRNILKCMKNIIENINKLDPDHYQDIKKPINNNLQLLERLILLFEYFITQQVSSYRVTSKLTSVVLNIFLELARKGFCIPPEFSDEISNDCQTQQSGGMGLGEGEGETDVSDRIESEDQLDDTKQEGQTERKNEDTDCKEEDNAIEMSEDFDSKLQDVSKQSDEENEEPDSDAEEQMGDTEKGADRLDEQIWSSDEEQDEESEIDKGNTNEEKGNKGEMEDEQKLGAKENQSADNRKPPDTQTEPENEQLIDKINEENPEYDDQVDPYHGNQPELPEPEPMDLPEDLDLDDDNEKANGEGEEENPFDIDTMKEQAPPDDKDEKKQEESGDNNKDEVDKPNESDDDVDIQENQQEDTELSKDKFEEERENTPAESKHDDDQEDTNKNQQTTLDQTHTDENQVQPMDTDKNVNESTDKVNANQAKNQISNENNPVNQEDTPDKEGVGQSQMEESSSGHRGAANAQQEAEDNKEECSEKQEKRQRPGESDSKRSLGDTLEPVKKKFKTIHTDDNEEIEESQPEKSNAEMYQHIKEAQDHTEQILDVATKEQVEQQKEIPNSDENELEKPTESSDNVPEAQENIDMTNEIKQKAEKLENEKSEAKSQHPEGDIVKDGDEIEMEVEGEIIQTSSVARGNQSSHHIQLSNFVTESIKLSNEDTTVIRKQIEEQLANWREIPSSEEAQRTWEKISSLTSPLAQNLSEQLRLVLEPTQASQLRGDFKTGKRINMRKIIPYIASQFRKDKIWLRRTKPAKREYQIVLAIDDSSSMDDNHSKELAFESVALISKALTLLESGQLSVLSFGESTELLHKLDESFTDKCGYKLLQKFQFDQRKTCLGGTSKFGLAFYEPPPRKTSSEIINEAKLAINGADSHVTDNSYATSAIKPLQTQRPFTPRDKERLLFGKKSKPNRPPSSFSLKYLQNESELSIPLSTPEDSDEVTPRRINATIYTANFNQKSKETIKNIRQRSSSISEINENKIFNVGVKELNIQKIKLPTLDSLKPIKKKLLKNTFSLDNLPEETETAIKINPEGRNAFSSPQEKTEFSELSNNNSPFGRSSKKQSLSQCLLLEPHNLSYFNNAIDTNKSDTKIYALDDVAFTAKHKTVDEVIELLIAESVKNHNDADIIELLGILYECMEKENMLNSKISSKTKIHILKCLYKFVESQNEKLLLSIARIILALKVTGNNLSGVCKLIFKVSKNDKNDNLFFQKNILELFVDAIGRSSPLDDCEACVYGYGSIKFLTMNSNLLQKILSLGVLPLMLLHIKIINSAKIDKSSIPEQTNHALFQLTGALRNLASDENLDIISNISRTLSTLSTNDNCCDNIADYQNIYDIFVRLFEKYPGNEEIIVRLTYTIGNIVARNDDGRIKFYNQPIGITSLIKLWKIYLERTLKCYSMKVDTGNGENGANNVEDVMIKIIRIIANVAINPEIGKKMNDKYGGQLIDEFLKVVISNPFKKNEELVLSVLSTLNNLSFYYTADMDPDIFHVKQVDIIEGITEYITSSNKECVEESMRILGNLSRSKISRNFIAQNEIFETLLEILGKSDINLLRTTVGVFVNLMSENKNRISLRNSGGISKLIAVMNNYGQYDWSLAMLVCQVIWNYCIDSVNLYELITDNELEQLTAVLVDFLDEEKLFGITDDMENNQFLMSEEFLIWEEFANVATNLLEKIEQFLDTVENLQSNCFQPQRPKTRDSSTNISFSAW